MSIEDAIKIVEGERDWIIKDHTGGTAGSDAMTMVIAELARLKAENERLTLERDTLIERWPQQTDGVITGKVIDYFPCEDIWCADNPMGGYSTKAEAVRFAAGLEGGGNG